jgi:hypothetical protein
VEPARRGTSPLSRIIRQAWARRRLLRAGKEDVMTATTTDVVEQERDLLVRCISEAYEELRLLPGLDANGPALVWFCEHLLDAYRKAQGTA